MCPMYGLEALAEALDELVAEGPTAVADGESLVALHCQLNRLQAVVASATATFETSGEWGLDGARSAAAWLAHRCRLPRGLVRRDVRLGRTVGDLPECGRAWLAGDIAEPHVATLAAVRRPQTEAALVRDEALLVGQARELSYVGFRRAVAYWEQLADPDGCDLTAEERRTRRDVHLAESIDGMWLGSMTLDPIAGTIVTGELGRLEQALFEDDWAEAHDRLGHDPVISELARTPAQRRADALVEMATRSRTAPAHGRRPVPLFTVLVGYETLRGRICELANGRVVSLGSVVPWLTEADIERVVFTAVGRVEVGATSRLFTGATRRAIEVRDRTCTHPYCDEPAGRCQVDHVVPWTAGGPTTQENGRLLCGFHNRLRNRDPAAVPDPEPNDLGASPLAAAPP